MNQRDEDGPEDADFRDSMGFRDPGGGSALRKGRRSFPCPTCGRPNLLSAKDKAAGYQCDGCADRDEGGFPGYGGEY